MDKKVFQEHVIRKCVDTLNEAVGGNSYIIVGRLGIAHYRGSKRRELTCAALDAVDACYRAPGMVPLLLATTEENVAEGNWARILVYEEFLNTVEVPI